MKKAVTLLVCLSMLLTCASCADNNNSVPSEYETTEESTSSAKEIKTEESVEIILPENYNRLQDIVLISDEIISSSIGFAKPDSSDISDKFGSVPVPTGEGILVLRNWNTTDLSDYLKSGEISFFVKGESGSDFTISLQDCDKDRAGDNDNISVYKNVSDYGSITPEWQNIKIPLRDFFSEESGLDISCIWTIRLGNGDGKTFISDMRIISSDSETTKYFIKPNQLGYTIDGEKYAIVSGFYEQIEFDENTEFYLIDKNGETAYSSELQLITEYDEEYSGERVYLADFSDFSEQGQYYIRLEKGGYISPGFEIGGNIYSELLGNACKYYYFQRANVPLTEEFAGKFARDALYTEDFNMPFLSDKNRSADVSGGWFDAGDFGKYVDPGATAVTDLLWAYTEFPDAFTDGLSDIPESGNGIPDILDEIKIELDFILKMQDEDGGFYHRVNPDDGSRAIVDTFSANDGGNIKSSGTTANAVAALSFASDVFGAYDKEYSEALLTAAKKGWEYISQNPDIKSSGTYGSEQYEPQIFFAACSLYRTTGEELYHSYIRENYEKYRNAYSMKDYGHGSDNMKLIAFAAYLSSENTDKEIVEWIRKAYPGRKKGLLSTAKNNPWRTALPGWALWWGSNSNALNCGMEMYLTEKYLGEDTTDSEKLCADSLNFILGCNPTGKSMVTGVGENCIKRSYSGIFGSDEITDFPVGYTPGGINMYDAGIISRFHEAIISTPTVKSGNKPCSMNVK